MPNPKKDGVCEQNSRLTIWFTDGMTILDVCDFDYVTVSIQQS